jgi:glucokinase
MAEHWLLADVGGSTTRVGLGNATGLIANSTRTYSNDAFDGLDALLASYLRDAGCTVSALCAGVAGPVRAGAVQLTNLDWFIEAAALQHATGVDRVDLINDLQAQAYALNDLTPAQLTPFFAGAPVAGAARLVLGIGTGSNIAVAHTVEGKLIVPPSESGHIGLPYCEGELGALIAHLGQAVSHRPMESALSGPGLQRIWLWLGGEAASPSDILIRQDKRAKTAKRLFTSLLGKVAGDLALGHLPLGGVYLIGGMARAIAPHLKDSGFHAEFTSKGPYSSLMRDIPIFLVKDDLAGLQGCARYLAQKPL